MGISKVLKLKIEKLDAKQKEKLVKMAIEDKTSFLEIKEEFSFTPGEIEKFILKELGEHRYKRWILRRKKRSTKKARPIIELD